MEKHQLINFYFDKILKYLYLNEIIKIGFNEFGKNNNGKDIFKS